MLETLIRWGSTETIMSLVEGEPRPNGGHSAGYARFHRLRKRGFITIEDGKTIRPTALAIKVCS